MTYILSAHYIWAFYYGVLLIDISFYKNVYDFLSLKLAMKVTTSHKLRTSMKSYVLWLYTFTRLLPTKTLQQCASYFYDEYRD